MLNNLLGQLFVQPLEVPTKALSLLWALPICLSIAAVYRAIKIECFEPRAFLREVLLLVVTLLGFLVLGALGLFAITALARL